MARCSQPDASSLSSWKSSKQKLNGRACSTASARRSVADLTGVFDEQAPADQPSPYAVLGAVQELPGRLLADTERKLFVTLHLWSEYQGKVELLRLADYIPSDAPHLTITGGEPFLIGDPIFVLLSYLRQTHPETEYQILTNGRIFAVPEMVSRFMASRPDGTSLGIPLHGPSAEIHDAIVQSKGAFRQTVTGVRGTTVASLGEKLADE